MRRLIGDDGVSFWTADTSLADTRTHRKDTKNHSRCILLVPRISQSVQLLLSRTGTFGTPKRT